MSLWVGETWLCSCAFVNAVIRTRCRNCGLPRETYAMPERCTAETQVTGTMALLANFGGRNQGPIMVRCRKETHTRGLHEARFSPFPGFADEMIHWSTDPVVLRTHPDDAGWERLDSAQVKADNVAAAAYLLLRVLKDVEGREDPEVTIDTLTPKEISFKLPKPQ